MDPVGAHHHEALGRGQIVMDRAAEGHLGGAELRAPAHVGHPGVVGATQYISEASRVLEDRPAGAAGHGDGLGTRGIADLGESGGDDVEGLVPADALHRPSPRAPIRRRGWSRRSG